MTTQVIEVADIGERESDLRRLLESQRNAVCVIDDADVSECIGWYRLPAANDDSPEDWPYTEIGHEVYMAKYKSKRPKAESLYNRLARHIKQHPLLSTAECVGAVPPSGGNTGRVNWPDVWARSLAKWLDISYVPITRTRVVASQKSVNHMGERRANQEGSMTTDYDLTGCRTLIIDDLYMGGETMREAYRACRAAGAPTLFGLSAAKTVKGSQGCWEI
jgi:predicted amidophosphoribosyltransferase